MKSSSFKGILTGILAFTLTASTPGLSFYEAVAAETVLGVTDNHVVTPIIGQVGTNLGEADRIIPFESAAETPGTLEIREPTFKSGLTDGGDSVIRQHTPATIEGNVGEAMKEVGQEIRKVEQQTQILDRTSGGEHEVGDQVERIVTHERQAGGDAEVRIEGAGTDASAGHWREFSLIRADGVRRAPVSIHPRVTIPKDIEPPSFHTLITGHAGYKDQPPLKLRSVPEWIDSKSLKIDAKSSGVGREGGFLSKGMDYLRRWLQRKEQVEQKKRTKRLVEELTLGTSSTQVGAAIELRQMPQNAQGVRSLSDALLNPANKMGVRIYILSALANLNNPLTIDAIMHLAENNDEPESLRIRAVQSLLYITTYKDAVHFQAVLTPGQRVQRRERVLQTLRHVETDAQAKGQSWLKKAASTGIADLTDLSEKAGVYAAAADKKDAPAAARTLGEAGKADPYLLAKIATGMIAFFAALGIVPAEYLKPILSEMGSIIFINVVWGPKDKTMDAVSFGLFMGALVAVPLLAPAALVVEILGGVTGVYFLLNIFNVL